MIKYLFAIICTIFVFGNSYGQKEDQAQKSDHYFEISKNLEIFSDLYKQIDLFYVDEESPGKMIKKGIDAMLKSLDPYTIYIPESKMEDYKFMTTGEYGGIGALIRKSGDYVMIAEPYKDFPAHEAGLNAGDIIHEIDGKTIQGKSSDEVSQLLKGQKGTKLKLKVKRNGEMLSKKLTRAEVKVDAVPYSGMLNDQVGYIKLRSFTRSASDETLDAFKELKSDGMEKLIFDLRGNGGGLLKEAVEIVNMFVEKGQTVVETKGRIESVNNVYKADDKPQDVDIPIVVLVNEKSASASEIVSGSLQDIDRAVVAGTITYGKGLVQQTRDLDYNSKIKLTVAKYYTPSGRCIQKLDYAHKDSKKVEEVPDSLLAQYETKNGRTVTDGRGIEPDVHIDLKSYSRLSAKLISEQIIFDYATKFYYENDTIPAPENFNFSDEQYNDFITYVKERGFTYTTASEEVYEELEKVAKKEGYYDMAEEEFNTLLSKLHPSTERDLKLLKNDNTVILENEIASRYYFQKGRVQVSIDEDPYISTAISLLENIEDLNGILSGEVDPAKYKYEEEGAKE